MLTRVSMSRRWVRFTNSHQLVWTRVYKHPEPWLPNQKDLCVPIGRITRGAVKVSTKTDGLDGGTKGGIFDPEAKGKKKIFEQPTGTVPSGAR